MIKQIEMFTVICDGCKEDSNEGSEYSCWSTKEESIEIASYSDWQEINDKHYCPNCCTMDDDGECVVKEKK